MDGIPSELWQQLTALIGNDRDEEDEGSDGDEEEEEEQSTAVNDPPLRAGRREETPVSDSKHDTDGGDEKEEREAEAEAEGEGEGEGEEVDESDDEQPVEIGLDECMMLKECLEKKLASLVSTEERYCTVPYRTVAFKYYSALTSAVATKSLSPRSPLAVLIYCRYIYTLSSNLQRIEDSSNF